jgi:hypothetical protein
MGSSFIKVVFVIRWKLMIQSRDEVESGSQWKLLVLRLLLLRLALLRLVLLFLPLQQLLKQFLGLLQE